MPDSPSGFASSASSSSVRMPSAADISRVNAAEIHTSFYRPHAATTYERWASAVPPAFHFAVKIPKLITHDRALLGARGPLEQFLYEIAGLGAKLGPLLLQLPPSFAFD